MPFHVYILKCDDGTYYTGHTDNLEKRMAQHTAGEYRSCYTYSRRPVTLVFSKTFPSRSKTLARERQVKGWGRKKKEALVCRDWDEVARLADSMTGDEGERRHG